MNIQSEWPFRKFNSLLSSRVKIVRCLITTIVISLLHFYTHGQSADKKYPEVNILSPNASSLGKYVDFPVNMHTGVPDVSIPIYTVTEGPLTLPISLSHHASGLKVQETASWVGAGWTLNAGGVVSRTVKGLPDEEVAYDNYSFWKDNGYSNYFTTTIGMSPEEKTDYKALLAGNKDGEPDLFFFNFSGYSGKFYFREDHTPVMIPEGDLKIEPYFKAGASAFSTYDYLQGFVITVPDGTKYYFGVTTTNTTDVDPVEKSGYFRSIQSEVPFAPPTPGQEQDGTICITSFVWGTEKVYSSWYLYKIESPDGKSKIELSYRAEDYAYHLVEASPDLTICDNINLMKTRVTGVALDKIKFSNGSVSFIPSTAAREDLCRNTGDMLESSNLVAKALAEIKIESISGAFCTSFKLSQSYFVNNAALPAKISFFGSFTSDKKRLKLDAIQEFSCNNTISKPPFVFKYYEETAVPRRLSFAQDHWGFNNGAETNIDLMPTIWTSTGVFSATFNDNREAQWPQMRAGALRSIQYPTGGGTEYIYEPNTVKTSQCNFTHDNNTILSVNGGMASATAGYGPTETRTFATPVYYYYRITTSGTGSGRFYIDNTPIASVTNGQTAEDYIALNPGTHTFRAYGDADTGSGSGVIVYFYASVATCVGDDKLVGGLRIKRIEQFGVGASPRLVKSFEYDLANLYSIPVYVYKLKNELLRTGILGTGSSEGGCKIDIIGNSARAQTYVSPVSVHPMQTTQGYHIGYGKVKEINPDGGYTVNEFKGLLTLPGGWQTLEDVCVRKIDVTKCNPSDPVYPFPPLPYDYGRGNLKSKQVFDKNNNKLTETAFTEEYLQNEAGVFGVNTGSYLELALPTHYDIKSARLLWQKQVNRVYNTSNPALFVQTESTTEFNSIYHQLPTKVSQTTNDGVQEERMKYVPDLTACNYECPGCASDYNSQLDALRVNYELNLELCSLGLNTGCDTLLGYDRHYYYPCLKDDDGNVTADGRWACRIVSWTDYQYRLNLLRKTYSACINTCKTQNSCLATGVTSTNPSVGSIYKLESKNQIAAPIESSVWKDSKLLQSFYFDYQLISNPPLDINLKKVFTTELTVPTTVFVPAAIVSGNIVKDTKYAGTPEITYEYDQGRIVEMTGRDGVKTSFIWGYNNTVPIVKAVGIDYNNLRTAYNANATTIRTHALTLKAMITTYQYNPLIGIVSIMDPSGKTQYYEYDVLSRLLRIKNHDGKILEQYEYQYLVN